MVEEPTEQDVELEKLIEADRTNIPSNDEIIKMIPSKAVREYLQKKKHQFSERDRFLLWLYLDPEKGNESNELWKMGRYVSVPHPFRRGDIVFFHFHNSDYAYYTHSFNEHSCVYDIGIMRSFKNDEAWEKWDNDVKTRLKNSADFSDVSTTVEFLCLDGSFSHNHPNPMQLDFARDIEWALPEGALKTIYLEIASELMSGKGSIELFEMYRDDYVKSNQHLGELLKSINKELHEYVLKNFDSYRSLYIPDNCSPIRKLTKEQKEDALDYIWRMECNVQTIENNVKDLVVPATTLKKALKSGSVYENDEIAEKERNYLKEAEDILLEIKSFYQLSQQRIRQFTEMKNTPRKQFYQNRLARAIKRMERLLH